MNRDFKVQPFYVCGLGVSLVMAFSVLYDRFGVFVQVKDAFWAEHLCFR